MPVPTLITDLSTTASSNSPSGGETPADGDNHIRALAAFIASIMANSGNGWTSPYATAAALAALPSLASGTYTPTVTAVTNSPTALSADLCTYDRVGSLVTVAGAIYATPGSSPFGTVVRISLPVPSTFAAAADAHGVANAGATTSNSTAGQVSANLSTTTHLNIGWWSLTTAAVKVDFVAHYRLL